MADSARYDEEKIDAKVKAERDRLVKTLHDLADRIDRAPLDRITGGLTWVVTTAETLIGTVEKMVKRDKPGA